jgi:hypothetical protein
MNNLHELLQDLTKLATKAEPSNKALFKMLKAKKPANLDYVMQKIHLTVFEDIDCLQCGNCCRSLGPRVTMRDIERLLKPLRLKTNQIIEKYLMIDEDNDYVFKSMPCPFLGTDNYCAVYEHRPQACREYPHLDRRKFVQILDLTLKNSFTCPAVYEALELLKKKYP